MKLKNLIDFHNNESYWSMDCINDYMRIIPNNNVRSIMSNHKKLKSNLYIFLSYMNSFNNNEIEMISANDHIEIDIYATKNIN